MKELQMNAPIDQVWVNHITGEKYLPRVDEYISPKLGILIDAIAHELQKSHEISSEEASIMAVNMITGEALRKQRDLSVKSHLALFTSCLAYHPDLSGFRRELIDEVSKDTLKVSDFIDYRCVFNWVTNIAISAGAVAMYIHLFG